MADRIDHLTERVHVVEVKVDHLTDRVQVVDVKVDRLSSTVGQLTTSVDGLTTSVDVLTTTVGHLTTTVSELSTAMAAGFIEQREYTEFSHARLESKMDDGFARVTRIERKLDQFIDIYRPRRTRKKRNE